jgi:uncharacterized damage-inducible protein DinB
MNKAQVAGMWDHMRKINGITMRVVAAIPKGKRDSHPEQDMRTPQELVVHLYTMLRYMAEGAKQGEITTWDEMEAPAGAKIQSQEDLLQYASECWNAADAAIQKLTDADCTAMVKTPWGVSYPGYACVQIIYDEHLHHRGQLYAYLRAMGVEPPFLWDFEHNAPEFRPKQHAES